jgi:hypothetical protein
VSIEGEEVVDDLGQVQYFTYGSVNLLFLLELQIFIIHECVINSLCSTHKVVRHERRVERARERRLHPARVAVYKVL